MPIDCRDYELYDSGMSKSKSIPFVLRLPAPMYAAAEAKAVASGGSLAEWVRGLIAAETGTSAHMPQGLASLSPTKRRRVAAAGGRAKAAGRPSQDAAGD
jgi:hypothetical protein